MFGKLLIANRGEIACRVIATARRMGIATVAIYSDADAASLHVALADEAYRIGPPPARASYLNQDAILAAAARSGAQAVHPGYGFLSENADFAAACGAAGLVFIGPPPSAIRAMGGKSEAKALMQRAGVPLVPGYHGAEQNADILLEEARRIGFPVLIKASAGGGGKGMRVVESKHAFLPALEGAQRESRAAFGDDRVLIERYLQRPRHIEIQVFADTHGNVVHLFERDCSIQRRHQKVLEEAPAPGMTVTLRAEMGAAAVAAARAVGYVGAGTVEFIVEDGHFHFMEMNTRLQVEHPVTELVTGLDLVEWQLRVAAGERLPSLQDALGLRGHAIEARLYAEDPARDFLPSVGTLTHLRTPAGLPGVRIDTGVRCGDAITPNYDPMIAKLIVHGADRDEAVRRLGAALAQYEVVGVQTNLRLLRAIAGHAAFHAGALDTGFIARHAEQLLAPAPPPATVVVAAAVIGVLLGRATPDPDPDTDPWAASDSWRMNHDGWQSAILATAAGPAAVHARLRAGAATLVLDGVTTDVAVQGSLPALTLLLDGARHSVTVLRDGGRLTVVAAGETCAFDLIDPLAPPGAAAAGAGRVLAPIPGRIAAVLVAPGDAVVRGQALVVLEAMKMELTLSAATAGTVATVRCAAGDMVDEGRELIELEADPAA
jgi:3-methylcrotonyl-CoA carboxylase alpha subunit